MFEIKLKIGGVEKSFKKDYLNIEDNLLAVEHQVRQTKLYNSEKFLMNPHEHRKVNEAYLKMFVDMFGGQFTIGELKKADASLMKDLEKIYLAALGGNREDEGEEDEKKEQSNLKEPETTSSNG